ncbi:MAG: transporter substrate-binding domain-containing protein [Clostridia bacterium]|nr:transporter substrate-binding domain-containing protein [Clostridia bacterium]
MKKIVSLILALVMCACVCLSLASCGETVNAKVGIQSGTTSEAYAKVLKGVEVVSFDTFALAAQAMKNGNADYVFVDKTTANALCEQIDGLKIIDIALSSEYYGIGIDPTQPSLKVDIDRILAEKADEIQAIKDKYMNGDEDAYVGVASATKDNSKAAQQLVVATNAEFAPWEYKEGNLYYGIDMEIAKLIADELDLELVIDDMQFNMVVGAVGKNGVDIAMSGITITTERQQVINFSTPYYTESIVVVCKATDTTFDSAGTVVDILNAICYPAETDAE